MTSKRYLSWEDYADKYLPKPKVKPVATQEPLLSSYHYGSLVTVGLIGIINSLLGYQVYWYTFIVWLLVFLIFAMIHRLWRQTH